MIRHIAAASALWLVASLLVPTVASAHVLQTDGSIGAVLHINPDDNPTSEHPADYVMAFNDDDGHFRLSQCDCTLNLLENDKLVATQKLKAVSDGVSENTITFPAPAVYVMRFTGTPIGEATFQPFTLSYNVRVTGEGGPHQPFPWLLWVGMTMTTGLILLAAVVVNYDIR